MINRLEIAQLGSSVIRRQAEEIVDIASVEIQELIDDMIYTCKSANGMGIAAPQVFHSKSIFIMSSEPNARYPHAPYMEATAVINPKITQHSKQMIKDWEGCLSLPGIRALVPRHKEIEVSYTDRFGVEVEVKFEDFMARLFQHEFDHLKGSVFIDRVESTKDIVMEKEYQRIITEAESITEEG